ncbi:MAG: hypothetical protein RL201_302 [Actinomycetota bacterium]
MSSDLKVGIVTKEWPPQVYGGAGVHVVQLTEALRKISGVNVDVHCFGGARTDGAFGYDTPSEFASKPCLASDCNGSGNCKQSCKRSVGPFAYLVCQHGRSHRVIALRNPPHC